MTALRTVMVTIDVPHDHDLPRVMEVAARAASGLILEGLEVRISTFLEDDESDDR